MELYLIYFVFVMHDLFITFKKIQINKYENWTFHLN